MFRAGGRRGRGRDGHDHVSGSDCAQSDRVNGHDCVSDHANGRARDRVSAHDHANDRAHDRVSDQENDRDHASASDHENATPHPPQLPSPHPSHLLHSTTLSPPD